MARGYDACKNFERYFQAIERDNEFVGTAINKGARLSLEEWHDFAFKSDVSAQTHRSISKYSLSYPAHRDMAYVEAMLFGCICSVKLTGYTYKKASKLVKSVIKQYNRKISPSNKLFFHKEDEDGTTYFYVESARSNNFVEAAITDRESLCGFLLDTWKFMVHESFLYNKETRGFIEDHLPCEVALVDDGLRPSPYLGCLVYNTLSCILREKTDYGKAENASTAVIKLYPTGTESARK